MIRIKSKVDGFRRCGVAHPATPTDYADDRFTDEELKALAAEPMLVVVSLPDPKPTKEAGGKKAKDK